MHYCIYTTAVIKNKPNLTSNIEKSPGKASYRIKAISVCMYANDSTHKLMENKLRETFLWGREGN